MLFCVHSLEFPIGLCKILKSLNIAWSYWTQSHPPKLSWCKLYHLWYHKNNESFLKIHSQIQKFRWHFVFAVANMPKLKGFDVGIMEQLMLCFWTKYTISWLESHFQISLRQPRTSKSTSSNIGRSKGGGGAKDAPLWVQFLSFSCSFLEKIGQIIAWYAYPEDWRTLVWTNPGSATFWDWECFLLQRSVEYRIQVSKESYIY